MLSNLTNNQILKKILTGEFLKSVENNLVPAIEEKWGSANIHMYEDLLKDPMLIDGRWYYPLTVLPEGVARTQWISWAVSADFKDKNPYMYVGKEDIDFELCDIPDALRQSFSDYVGYSGKIGIEIAVEAVARDITFLSGRYSQSFVDEMSRQITEKMSTLMSCEGLSESSLSLLLTFAPESYFEHTSENVTYRRLLLIDKGAQPRDFWIKWTRLNSAVGYSVSDVVASDDIEFEIGEDVPQKIREKEYRFLLREGRDKYQNSMGRKNVTEWREIIRRAIKRGDLTKIQAPVEEIVFEDDLSAKLMDILGDSYKAEPVQPAADETPMGEDYIKALEIAKGLVEAEDKEEETPEFEMSFGEGVDIFDLGEEAPVPEEEKVESEPAVDIFEIPEAPSFAEVAPKIEEAPTVKEPAPEVKEEPVAKISPTAEEIPSFTAAKTVTIVGEVEKKTEEAPASAALRDVEARVTELTIRLEYERQMRERLEAEIERLKRGESRLIMENENLKAIAKAEELRYRAAEERFKLEIARLTAQNEILTRSEERQKERLATAARDAVERQKMLEEEKRRIAEENARLAREKEAALTPAPKAAPAPAPVEPALEEALAPKASPDKGADKYTYVSKSVRLMFRRAVDPNITGRIYEIIKATLEYFGKEKMNLRIKASVPDSETVNLEFTSIPMEEMQLLSDIIQVLGSSGLGIAKAIVE